jgi:hypothetical protein
MPWAEKSLLRLSALLAVTALSGAARAQTCAGARPSYGSAELGFYDSASGLSRVHYALSGTHAPPALSTLEDGVPDAVVVAAQAADDALATYRELGYRAPLSDGGTPCSDDGGSDALDIYLLHFSAADGQASLDHCQGGSPKVCAGFVLVENDFKSGGYADTAEGLRTVVPHELFHLVQDAYDADLERWWAEGSAQWAAKQVYPELRDLERFLPAYFDVPWRPLNVPPPGIITNFLYATAIWPVFLHERLDADVVREVFEGLDGATNVLPVTDAVLQARGSSLAQEFAWFAAYNAATGKRAPESGGYANAADYPEVPVEDLPSGTPTDTASGLGAYYYALPAGSPALELDADSDRVAALLVPLVDGKADLASAQPLPAQTDGDAIVVVAAQSVVRTDAPFTLREAAESAGEGGGGGSGGTDVASGPESNGCSVSAPVFGSPHAGGLFGIVVAGWLGRRRFARSRKDHR